MNRDAVEPISELPRGEFAFPGPLRDGLVNAILNGTKTATASLLAEYPNDYQPHEEVEALEAVLDSHDNVVCVIRTADVQVCRLADVSDEHAIAEGEGYTDAGEWRAGHERYWRSPEFVEYIGALDIDDDTEVVCQRCTVDERYPISPIEPWDSLV